MLQRTLVGLVACSMACGSNGSGGSSSVLDGVSPAHIGSAADMDAWKTSSAPGVFFASLTPLIAAQVERGSAGTCPVVTMNGTTTTYQGGCSGSNGDAWVGQATEEGGSGSATGDISYQGFGFTGSNGVTTTYDGTVTASSSGNAVDYAIDITLNAVGSGSNNSGAISYSATAVAVGSGSDQMTTWNGNGELGSTLEGKVSASTKDELIQNSVCSHKPLSGTTTIVAGADTAVITYNGAGSCDQTATAPWTLDGMAETDLTGVSCSVGDGGSAWIAGIMIVLGLRRRRGARSARGSTSPR